MKRVLIITRHYLDENNGGSNGSKAYIRALSTIYSQVDLIYPEHNDKSSAEFIPSGVTAIPCYDRRGVVKKCLDVYKGYLTRFPGFVKKFLKNHTYDIIVLDHSILAPGLIHSVREATTSLLTIHHNNESQYVRDNLPNLIYRIPYVHYVKKVITAQKSLNSTEVRITTEKAIRFITRIKT